MMNMIEYRNPPNNKKFYRTLVLSLPGLVRYSVMLTMLDVILADEDANLNVVDDALIDH